MADETAEIPLQFVGPKTERIRLIQGWRPIISAPKDGDELDLFGAGRRWTDCHWHCGEWLRWETSSDGGGGYRNVPDPTHWMRVMSP